MADEKKESQAVVLKGNDQVSSLATLNEIFKRNRETWEKLQSDYMPVSRLEQLARIAFQGKRELWNCTIASVMKSLNDAARLGLEPDSPAEHGYLIPRRNNAAGVVEASFQLGYKGLMEVITRGEDSRVTSMYARVVHEKDEWEPPVETGTGQEWRHRAYGLKPDEKEEPGAMFCAYSVATFKDGHREIFTMTKQEIEQIRDQYSMMYRSKPKESVWVQRPSAAWLKTVILHHGRKLPKSKLAQAVYDYARDEDAIDTTFTVLEGGKSGTDTGSGGAAGAKDTKPKDEKKKEGTGTGAQANTSKPASAEVVDNKAGADAKPAETASEDRGGNEQGDGAQAEGEGGGGPMGDEESAPPMDGDDDVPNRVVTADEINELSRAMKEAKVERDTIWWHTVKKDPRGKDVSNWRALPYALWREIMATLQKTIAEREGK